MTPPSIPRWKDKILFTPGPLTTSPTVKQAMLRDLGSRDAEFIELVKSIRARLVALGKGSNDDFTAVPMQGSGTFGIEAMLSTAIPRDGKLLVALNGAYGRRIVDIATALGIVTVPLPFPEHQITGPSTIDQAIQQDPSLTHVAVVHCETTTGIVNPIESIGPIVRRSGRSFLVDAMSSFGALPIDLEASCIDYLVSSANKCIEGVPGFSFVLARLEKLKHTEGHARGVALDLFAQWKGLQANGQFRFTPPTHALLAFAQALDELDREGGVEGRGARYRRNHQALVAGMRTLGFQEYLGQDQQGPIITTFHYPKHQNFSFERLYESLGEKGYVIYPGKLTNADCFRIGTVGRIDESDVADLLAALSRTLLEMNVSLS